MGLLNAAVDPLKIVSAAVTPVVMISATAILISGVNARYMAVADRVRSLAHEYRGTATEERRASIRSQIPIFHRRLHLVSWATRALYVAVACFVAVTLLISLSSLRLMLDAVLLPLFLAGLGLAMLAIILQLVELQAGNSTIHLEMDDILVPAAHTRKKGPHVSKL